ncbi:hypothetical protein J2S55_008339 [Streptosporangium brasiliense]|uniref:Uncharacterized protein n=1 Tax=Streptosporangium brasiliense TaxID=47480 RepID=A0ABT9RIF4_9ACTN|nr:hypothetical protein [Streptosporangium brasiliense]
MISLLPAGQKCGHGPDCAGQLIATAVVVCQSPPAQQPPSEVGEDQR